MFAWWMRRIKYQQQQRCSNEEQQAAIYLLKRHLEAKHGAYCIAKTHFIRLFRWIAAVQSIADRLPLPPTPPPPPPLSTASVVRDAEMYDQHHHCTLQVLQSFFAF